MAFNRIPPVCFAALFAALPALPQAAPPAAPARITYTGGQLTIEAHDLTVAELLRRVAAVTGATVDLDIAPAAATERLVEVNVGPGPARSIVGALLAETGFDYLIQASDADPDKVRTILLMARDRKDLSPAPARETTVARVEETPAAAGEPSTAPAQDSASVTASAAVDAPSAQASRIPIANQPLIQPAATPQLAPPSAVTPQAVNSQLLQMYQQRMQMVQQQNRQSQP